MAFSSYVFGILFINDFFNYCVLSHFSLYKINPLQYDDLSDEWIVKIYDDNILFVHYLY